MIRRNKKGIESVEVWMWVIAGLIIGGLIFVSGYTLLSRWIHNNELNQAHESFSMLKSSILNVCSIGTERQEIEEFVFPRVVKNITISDVKFEEEGIGNNLCIMIEGEPRYCEILDKEPNTCSNNVTMQTLSFEEEKNLFSQIQKVLGDKKSAKIRFTISKFYDDAAEAIIVKVQWKEEFVK
ncbi:MAG: hypothetical protein KKF44_05325 [Nanoarchaeota archaeon]|nr:hypothetical protein [Nanoarchaeota archaeon]